MLSCKWRTISEMNCFWSPYTRDCDAHLSYKIPLISMKSADVVDFAAI
jgi:hypothetical protein